MDLRRVPAVVKRDMATAELPANYEKAKAALAACASLDEVKEWANRMAAIASYAKQANDRTLEDCAKRIRHRAMRRLGEMLADLPVGNKSEPNLRKAAALHIGLDQPTTSRVVRIASIPKPRFEALVDSDPVPSLKQLDPGWAATLANKTPGGAESIKAYTDLHNAMAPLTRMCCVESIDPELLAKEIAAMELPPEYLRGLKINALILSEWLDKLDQHLPSV